jgi:hypothetical protein
MSTLFLDMNRNTELLTRYTDNTVMDDTFTTAPAPVVAFLDGKHSVEVTPHHEYGYASGQVIPTDEELETLPKVSGTMPWTSYLLCGVEFAERASYYGASKSSRTSSEHHFLKVEMALELLPVVLSTPLALLERELSSPQP